ncbi:MAG: hypothetical protein OXU81_23695 [Gammaproteobacteria bacterium]|nr:hypothetical protein [Gammaproteobacteria bacterium]
MLRTIAALFALQCMSGSVFALSIPDDCHRLYEFFGLVTTYEDTGQAAMKLNEEGCRPALQAGPAASEPEAAHLPEITDCETLAAHITRMTLDEAGPDSPTILRLHDSRPLTVEARNKLAMPLIMKGSDVRHMFSNPVSGTTRVLDCIAGGRFESNNDWVQYYLDRDPDGQEFIGYTNVMSL